MISPVSPYKICAVIYYQGESDVDIRIDMR